MNPAIRGGAALVIGLLAVFPCGAALTVLGTLAVEVLKAHREGVSFEGKILPICMTVLWAGAGVLGYLSLIHTSDKLLIARQRLRWYEIIGVLIGILAAGTFALTYPLRFQNSALLIRLVCLAPPSLALLLLVYHLYRSARAPRQS
jgi:hypothetical protein